jgi:hypothetical protein
MLVTVVHPENRLLLRSDVCRDRVVDITYYASVESFSAAELIQDLRAVSQAPQKVERVPG